MKHFTTSRGDERRRGERVRLEMSQEEVRIEVFDGCDDARRPNHARFRFFNDLRCVIRSFDNLLRERDLHRRPTRKARTDGNGGDHERIRSLIRF